MFSSVAAMTKEDGVLPSRDGKCMIIDTNTRVLNMNNVKIDNVDEKTDDEVNA